MELHSLQAPTVTTIASSLYRVGLIGKPFAHGQVLKFPNFKKYPDATKLKILDFRALASAKVSSGAVETIPNKVDMKDENLVFVAGATGKVGSRTVRELLKLGFGVRAGVRSAQRAETLVKSVQQMKLDGVIAGEAVEKLELVECDLEKRDQIEPALGNASVVICCIGASEKEVFDITGPYRIDYQATKNLIVAATAAKVNHFIMVSSLGTNKVGFPAAILNLFWGVLIWKRKAEEALIASGLPYTIVRPGGMERPTDAYKETHNITLSLEDTLFGGQVSNLQVAELMAFMAKNRGLSYCKVVEVIAETTAPLTPLGDLLAKIPSQRVDVYSPKESDAVDGPDPASSKSAVSETPSTPIEKEPAQAKPVATRPLSPYIAYDDLKPPTSPSPTPPSGQKDVNITNTSTIETTTGIAEEKPALAEVKITRPLSPYVAYDDFKPPTSPSPSAPNLSPPQTTLSSGNNTAQPTDTLLHTEPKLSPLSPFTMYEDLKPPASPSPSPRKY